MWLYISVHDAFGVTVVQSLFLLSEGQYGTHLPCEVKSTYFEKFEHVIPDIIISESGVEHFEVDVVDVFCDQAWDLGSRIADHVQQGYDIWASSQVLENFDFSLDLLLLNGLEDFYDALFVVDDVDSFKDLSTRIFGIKSVILGLADHQGLCSPLNIFPVLPSEQSRSGLETPTGPVDCLRRRDQR